MDENNFNDWRSLNESEAQKKWAKAKERIEIRRLGTVAGGALLAFLFIQNIFVVILSVFGKLGSFSDSPIFQSSVEILSSIFCILLPFLFFGRMMAKHSGAKDFLPLSMPRDKALSLLSLPFGLGVCMAANIVTSLIITALKAFGVELSAPDIARPGGTFGFILTVTAASVTAALVEELSLRGCVMQNLRKYGDGFAVVMSALTFGIMHMNLVQAPFAVMVGLALGYITVKTQSLWPAIVIHGLNNFISVAVTSLSDNGMKQEYVGLLYSFMMITLIAFGVIAGIFFIRRANRTVPAEKPVCLSSAFGRAFAFLTSPTVIIAVIIMLIYTSKFVAVK